jgi:prepilin signal peptidase PulO-like enzyme (type II secretory pathway)
MALVLVIILGLAVGSFLNVVIYRLHAGVSFLRGRSYCPHCKHNLVTRDLIPVFSFLFLKGRCRYCAKPISWQYPLVEAGTAAAFALLYGWFGLTPDFFVYLVYASFLIIIFTYDLRYYLILDVVTIPAMVIAMILSLFVLKIPAMHLLLGGIIGGGFFVLQFLISKGKWIGGGDIRLGIAMGLMLGYQHLLIALFVAYLLGSVVGICLVLVGRKTWGGQVPFGTFLSAATFLTFLFGSYILEQYLGLLFI